MTNAPKPVFPGGIEPSGLRRDEYEWSTTTKQEPLASRKTTVRPVEVCWYCGDELRGRYSDVSTETGSAECDYSPTGMHELSEQREPCFECGGTGQCQECNGRGDRSCKTCQGDGICMVCEGTGEEPDVELWNREDDTYLGGFSDRGFSSRGWDPARESLQDFQKRQTNTYKSHDPQSTHSDDWRKATTTPRAYDWREYSKGWKPEPKSWRNWFWSEYRSREAAKSDNLFVRLYGRYRDAQDFYASCPEKRHWGPRGGAGLVPWTIAPDGKVYVLMSHRSRLVENGDTWSSFGGAIDKNDKSPFHAAVREAFEEVEGLPATGTVTREIARPCHACGWVYTTFLIRIEPTSVRVNRKAGSGWETEGVKWVEADQVSRYNLHPGFAKSWPELYEAITEAAK